MQIVTNLLALNRRTCKEEHYKTLCKTINYYAVVTVKLILLCHASSWPIIGLPAG